VLSFCVGYISLSIMSCSSSILLQMTEFVFFMTEKYSIYVFLIHLSVARHLGWFHILATVSSVAIRIDMQVSLLYNDFILFEYIPRSEIAASGFCIYYGPDNACLQL
jgi:hypothetical protein